MIVSNVFTDRFLEFSLENGQLTETIICDLEVLCQTTSTISRRDIKSDICHPVDHTQGESNC